MIERMVSNSGVTRIPAALSGRFSPNSAIGSLPFAPSIGVPRLRSSCPVSFRYRDCEPQRLGTASEAAPELLRIAEFGFRSRRRGVALENRGNRVGVPSEHKEFVTIVKGRVVLCANR